MGTNCAPRVAYLYLCCYERDFMLSLSDNNQADARRRIILASGFHYNPFTLCCLYICVCVSYKVEIKYV